MNAFRKLNVDECEMVSGGFNPPTISSDIVVNGQLRPWYYNVPGLVYVASSGTFSFAQNPTSFGSSGSSHGNGSAPVGDDGLPLRDENHDGYWDNAAIVVTSSLSLTQIREINRIAHLYVCAGVNVGVAGGVCGTSGLSGSVYVGLGYPPGIDVSAGVSTDANAQITGPSISGTGVVSGYNNSGTVAALGVQVGTPGVGVNYGVGFDQISSEFGNMFDQFSRWTYDRTHYTPTDSDGLPIR